MFCTMRLRLSRMLKCTRFVLRDLNPNRNENWIVREHNRSFIPWFRDHIYSKYRSDPASVTERLRCLAYGPTVIVLSYSAYAINGYTFYTKEQDDKSTMQNSGVTLVAEAMHISNCSYKFPEVFLTNCSISLQIVLFC